ncbi:ribose 5-phosphate isomerase B [Mycoplasma marinum]|uniref:Ribose 5-phosphate isomerase B n=1 Tax=Mycoplasma marinum TaxID=1937190 RepID=A0A4R0XT60_9MOLU|nr:ribose 5-phosphate isomerase B [Mycoplasma marinum]TCG10809.1 ribose 5-phosphate isomerase B [Mycoplasma marinum]
MKILMASDHAGFKLKKAIEAHLLNKGYEVQDLGCDSPERANYASYGLTLGEAISNGKAPFGIAVCGSGIGISIAANRFKGVRAARVFDVEDAKLTRQHNDSNVIALGERLLDEKTAIEMVDAFLNEKFEGGRHQKRVETLDMC